MFIPAWILLIVCLILAGIATAFWLSRKSFASLHTTYLEVERQKNQIGDFLTVFANSLRDNAGPAEAMSNIAHYIAELVNAQAVCIYEYHDGQLAASGLSGAYPLYRGHRSSRMLESAHLLERLRREKIPLGAGFIGEVALSQLPELLEDPGHDPRFADYPEANLSCIIAMPMLRNQRLTGVICAVNSRVGVSFSEEQYEQMRFISTQVVVTQELFRVYAEVSRQQRIHQELEFARQLQSSLLPESVPAWDQFAVHAFTRSAKEVNGDFYDFVEIDDNRLLIVMGDACGKGVPACMLTSMTRSFIRSIADHFADLPSFLQEVNKNLYRDSDAERFVTLACCLLDRRHSIIEYARSGHTDLLSFVRGHIRRLSPDGTALGILPNEFATFDSVCFEFQTGMSLLLFSDGISEALNADGEEYGTERLQEVFKQSRLDNDTPQKTLNRILKSVGDFSVEQIDDQTMILIQHI